MPSALPFTGERFTPECAGGIWYEHWHRYVLVRAWVAGKVVLDAACGEGYGSAFLAETAARVVGVDVSSDAVTHARSKYGGKANLQYLEASATSIPLPDGSIDIVVSFETIEHLQDQEAMLAEFRRVLRPDGILVLSAPNRPVYSEEKNYRNEYHVREHDRMELSALLSPRFSKTNWYGQRLLFNSVTWSLANSPVPHAPVSAVTMDAHNLQPTESMPEPMYFLTVSGGESAVLPEAEPVSLFADAAMSVLKQYEQLMAWQWEAKDHIAKLESQVASLKQTNARQLADHEAALNANRDALAVLDAAAKKSAASLNDAEAAIRAMHEEARSIRAQFEHRNSLIGWLKWPLHRVRRLFSS